MVAVSVGKYNMKDIDTFETKKIMAIYQTFQSIRASVALAMGIILVFASACSAGLSQLMDLASGKSGMIKSAMIPIRMIKPPLMINN
jgi:hypothetical protein